VLLTKAVARLVALADPSPLHRPVDEIRAEDHTDEVELEALPGVDAADLFDPFLRARPRSPTSGYPGRACGLRTWRSNSFGAVFRKPVDVNASRAHC
jgi:hypothetical protein